MEYGTAAAESTDIDNGPVDQDGVVGEAWCISATPKKLTDRDQAVFDGLKVFHEDPLCFGRTLVGGIDNLMTKLWDLGCDDKQQVGHARNATRMAYDPDAAGELVISSLQIVGNNFNDCIIRATFIGPSREQSHMLVVSELDKAGRSVSKPEHFGNCVLKKDTSTTGKVSGDDAKVASVVLGRLNDTGRGRASWKGRIFGTLHQHKDKVNGFAKQAQVVKSQNGELAASRPWGNESLTPEVATLIVDQGSMVGVSSRLFLYPGVSGRGLVVSPSNSLSGPGTYVLGDGGGFAALFTSHRLIDTNDFRTEMGVETTSFPFHSGVSTDDKMAHAALMLDADGSGVHSIGESVDLLAEVLFSTKSYFNYGVYTEQTALLLADKPDVDLPRQFGGGNTNYLVGLPESVRQAKADYDASLLAGAPEDETALLKSKLEHQQTARANKLRHIVTMQSVGQKESVRQAKADYDASLLAGAPEDETALLKSKLEHQQTARANKLRHIVTMQSVGQKESVRQAKADYDASLLASAPEDETALLKSKLEHQQTTRANKLRATVTMQSVGQKESVRQAKADYDASLLAGAPEDETALLKSKLEHQQTARANRLRATVTMQSVGQPESVRQAKADYDASLLASAPEDETALLKSKLEHQQTARANKLRASNTNRSVGLPESVRQAKADYDASLLAGAPEDETALLKSKLERQQTARAGRQRGALERKTKRDAKVQASIASANAKKLRKS